MKKKFLTLLLVFCLMIPCAFALVACGGNDGGSNGNGGGSNGGGSGGGQTITTTHTVNFYKGDTLVGSRTYSNAEQFMWMDIPYVNGNFEARGWFLDKGTWQQEFIPYDEYSTIYQQCMSMPASYDVHLYYKSFFNVVDGDLVNISSNVMWNLQGGALVVPETVTDADGTQTITKFSLSEAEIYNNYSEVTSITLPNTITEIAEGSFKSFPALQTINYTNSRYAISNTLIDTQTKTLIWASSEVTEIPNGVEVVGDYVFKGFQGQSITIPSGITKIGDSAFKNSSLTSVTIPATVTYVGKEAFYSSGLNTVEFALSDDPNRNLEIGEGCFYNTYLNSVTIPFIGRTIDDSREANYLFDQYYTIQNMVITEAKTLVTRCFRQLKVNNLTLPKTLESVEQQIFDISYAPDNLTIPFIGESRTSLQNAHLGWYFSSSSYNVFSSVTVTDGGMIAPNFSSSNYRTYNFTAEKAFKVIGENAFKDNYDYDVEAILKLGVEEIQASAFENCYLRNIDLGAGTKIIGVNAFKNNYAMDDINLPEGLISIGDNAFENTYAETIVIPSTVVSIGAGAFKSTDRYNDSTIASITFSGNNLLSVGDNAFEKLPLITSLELPTSVQTIGSGILKNSMAVQKLTIPYVSRVYTVFGSSMPEALTDVTFTNATKVDDLAFVFNSVANITTINLNNEVTSIGTNAFPSSVTTLNIPTSLKVIKDRAFIGCTLLENIVLPDSLESIGEYAFKDLTNIFDVVKIGKNVTYIGNGAFAGVDFSGIELHAENTTFTSNGKYLTDEANKRVLVGSSDLNVTNYVDFDHNCFNGVELTNVTFSNQLNSIGDYAFANTGITALDLPITTQTIGEGAFLNCPVVTLRMPFVGESRSVPTSTYEMFGETLQETLTTINVYDCETLGSMSRLYKLTNVTLCDSISTFANGVFSGCTSLTEITLPKELAALSQDAFAGCTKLTTINFNDKLTEFGDGSLSGCGFTVFVIPNTIKTLGAEVFRNCASLYEVYVPNSVEVIGGHHFAPLFRLCKALKYVYCEFESEEAKPGFVYGWCSNNNGPQTYYEGITRTYYDSVWSPDGNWAHHKDGKMLHRYRGTEQNVVVPAGFASIDLCAFMDNTNIVSVDLSKTTISVVADAIFIRCTNLAKVVFPDTVVEIGDSTFYSCTNLTDINLGKVKTFKYQAFAGCEKLSNVDISSAETISYLAFANCPIESQLLVLPSTLKTFADDAFVPYYSDFGKIEKIYVPASVENLYVQNNKQTSYKIYCAMPTAPSDVTSVPSYLYFNCVLQDSLVLSADKTIVYGTSIEGECILPESVTTIDRFLFEDTTKVTSLIMTDNVTTINLFGVANGLKYVRLSAGVKQYSTRIININNNTIETIIFPQGVNRINEECVLTNYVKNVYIPAQCYIEARFIPSGADVTVFYGGSKGEFELSRTNYVLNSWNMYYYMSPEGLDNFENLKTELQAKNAQYEGVYSFTIAGDMVAINSYLGEETTSLVIADGIKAVYAGFSDMGLETVDLNDVEYVFGGFDNNNFTQIDLSNVKFIGYQAFYRCTLLESVNLPNTVSVGSYAFNSCTSLTSITLGQNLKILMFGAFSYCTALTTLYIPSSIQYINSGTHDYTISSICNGCAETLVIYTDAEEANINWDASWNRKDNSSFYDTQYGVKYEDYLAIINAA